VTDNVAAAHASMGRRDAFRSMRPRAVLGAGIAASTIVAVSMADGGFFTNEWRWTGLALLCFVAVALLVTDHVELGRVEISALLALTALIAWTMLSAIWSSEPQSSVLETERGLVYLVCLVAVLLVSDAVGVASLVGGLLGGIVLVCMYSLGDWVAAAPSLHRLPLLIGPIGYSNGLGLLAAVGVLLALGLAFSGAGRGRAVALLSVLVLAPTLVLTESRGAWLALVVGLAATAALFPRRSLATLTRTALAIGGAAAVGFGLVWPVAGKGLVTVTSADNRLQLWHAAWRDYLAHPLLGSGAGTFGAYWYGHASIPAGALDAHSLYLESLAELGPVGLVLLLVFIAVPLRAAWGQRDALSACLCGAFVVYAVHTGFDWDWELPAVTMTGVSLAGLLLVRERSGASATTLRPGPRLALLGVALVLAGAAVARLEGSGRLW
jgi:O-antigen ligase